MHGLNGTGAFSLAHNARARARRRVRVRVKKTSAKSMGSYNAVCETSSREEFIEFIEFIEFTLYKVYGSSMKTPRTRPL